MIRSRPLVEQRGITERFKESWLQPIVNGKINPTIDSKFPLAEARAAYEYMEANKYSGRIILTMD